MPSVIAAAIAGVTPEYGLHLKENRYGQVLVDLSGLDHSSLRLSDYSAIVPMWGGLWSARTRSLSASPRSSARIKSASSSPPCPRPAPSLSATWWESPRSSTVEAALGGKPPEDKIYVGIEEMKSSFRKLTTTPKDDVDMVTFGCPHCSIPQIREIASLLEGKRVNPNTRLWVATSGAPSEPGPAHGVCGDHRARRRLVLADLCVAPGAPFHLVQGVKTVASTAPGSLLHSRCLQRGRHLWRYERLHSSRHRRKWRGPR